MDRQFLEFWGNVLLTAAKGQQQLEELAPWLKDMGADSHEWASLFRKIYGLDTNLSGTQAWDQATRQFQSSLKEWLALFDMVPRSELTEAQNKIKDLEQQLTDQQVTIAQLQELLNQKGIPSSKAVLEFSHLMQKQSDQFQELMGSIGNVFKSEKDTPKS